MTFIPEIVLTQQEIDLINELRGDFTELDALEGVVQRGGLEFDRRYVALQPVRDRVREAWRVNDHVVIRRLPKCPDGITGLLFASLCFTDLKRYRGGKIVKHFRMSPWTKALSHTLASGFFHTDLNTSEVPPAVTAMQCLDPDPGAPEYGQLRVARLQDLADRLWKTDEDAAKFLLYETVTMVNETSPSGWQGAMVADGLVRFHPESLLAAQKHLGCNPASLPEHLAAIHQAALDVSAPINLEPGELLLVSNKRALHQRGACTVRFQEFPSEFQSRRVSVFHAYDEPV
ncbi:TauD/TfdA family dioxygenase [Paraburkholderia sp. Cy-641]|uniref:TauD/TfdA family dioxygenase n=1 Tax=Paraburkholderia sp. Cy-641 TaxID=2608337 RepID=UPI0014224ECF